MLGGVGGTTRMHDDELMIGEALVRSLLQAQFPRWARLPLTRVASEGTDNAIFRLGDAFSVRLPKIEWAAEQTIDDHRWLARLAPALPLAIPDSLAVGQPALGYPYNWAIHRWLAGEVAWPERLADPLETAEALAGFIRGLRAIDAEGAFEHPRGVDLAERDEQTRSAIATSHERGLLDGNAATKAWERSLKAASHSGELVPVHADLHALNLLARDGRLCAVLDFGCLRGRRPSVRCHERLGGPSHERSTRFPSGARRRRRRGVGPSAWLGPVGRGDRAALLHRHQPPARARRRRHPRPGLGRPRLSGACRTASRSCSARTRPQRPLVGSGSETA